MEIWQATLGPQHPEVARPLTNLGNVAWALGENEQARALYERAIAIKEATLGSRHPAERNKS